MRKWYTVFVNDQARRVLLPPRRHFRPLGALWGLTLGLSEGIGYLVIFHCILALAGFVGLPLLIDAYAPQDAVGLLVVLAYIEWFCWILPALDYEFVLIWLHADNFSPVALVLGRHVEDAERVFDDSLCSFMRDRMAGVLNNDQSSVFLPILDINKNYYNHVLSRLTRDIAFLR